MLNLESFIDALKQEGIIVTTMRTPSNEYNELIELGNTDYGITALLEELDQLEQTGKGFRNAQLNTAACKLGSLVASGELLEDTVENNLIQVCHRNGLIGDDGIHSALATIESGMRKGMQSPRYPVEKLEESIPKIPSNYKLSLKRTSTIKPEKIDWLWEGFIAKGHLSLLAADPGIGKSQVSMYLAGVISKGGYWPGTKKKAPLGNVIIVNTEDGLADTITPRLIACGADRDRVYVLAEDNSNSELFKLDLHIPQLEEMIADIGDVELIIIDPVSNYLSGRADNNKSGDVRNITSQLSQLAQKYHTSVLMVTHKNKGEKSNAIEKVMGSGAWVQSCRTAFGIERDEDGRKLVPIKNNLAIDDSGYTFRIEGVTLDDGIETSRVVWEDQFQGTADEMMNDKLGNRAEVFNEAKGMLEALLENGARRTATELMSLADHNGISEKTLRRAKSSLNISSAYDKSLNTYVWFRPEA